MEEAYEESISDELQPVQVVYATFLQRLGAMVLDIIVLLLFSLLNRYNSTEWKNVSLMIIVTLIALCYKPLFEYLYSATLGKKALSIIITNQVFEKPDLQEILLRNSIHIGLGLISLAGSLFVLLNPQFSAKVIFAHPDSIDVQRLTNTLIVSGVISVIYLADTIVLLVNKQNRSLHDFIGKTLVIRKR